MATIADPERLRAEVREKAMVALAACAELQKLSALVVSPEATRSCGEAQHAIYATRDQLLMQLGT